MLRHLHIFLCWTVQIHLLADTACSSEPWSILALLAITDRWHGLRTAFSENQGLAHTCRSNWWTLLIHWAQWSTNPRRLADSGRSREAVASCRPVLRSSPSSWGAGWAHTDQHCCRVPRTIAFWLPIPQIPLADKISNTTTSPATSATPCSSPSRGCRVTSSCETHTQCSQVPQWMRTSTVMNRPGGP